MAKKTRKTWQEKLHVNRKPELERVERSVAGVKAGQLMLIPTPLMVDEYVRKLPRGTSVDVGTMRRDLAKQAGADISCPLTTGIFLRIVSEAAYEAFTEGKPLTGITPFWRVVDEKSSLAKKLSCGADFIRLQRAEEKIG